MTVGRRTAVCIVLASALVGDAALGAVRPAAVRPPVLLLAAVVAVATCGGVRAGMLAGFAAGIVLDALSGPASLAGVHTLTALLAGTTVGYARRHAHRAGAFALIAGGLAVTGAGVVSVALHRLLGYAGGDMIDGVAVPALVAGTVVTPLAHRALRHFSSWPLSQHTLRT
ncbi:MAG TPA: hypothetical protein VK875_02880 [Euzebyales bacterium]|nr:hypothetical protein [Euzebyales bacterium]